MKKIFGLILALILCMAPAMAEAVAPAAEAPVAAEALAAESAFDPGLTLVGSFPGGTGAYMQWVRNSDVLVQEIDDVLAFFKADGTALSDLSFCDYENAVDGYIAARTTDMEMGVLSVDGRVAVPFEYGFAVAVNGDWAIAGVLNEGTEDDHDFTEAPDGTEGYYYYGSYHVYDLNTGTKVGTLPRNGYEEAEAVGNCVNIRDTAGVVTTYGPGFEALGQGDYLYEEEFVPQAFRPSFSMNQEGFQYVMRDAMTNEIARNDYPMSGRCMDGYVQIYTRGENGTLYGLATADGTVIIPMEYEDILYMYDLHYMYQGYAAARIGDVVDFYDMNGNKTCSTEYLATGFRGLSVAVMGETPLKIVAADGTETVIEELRSAYPLLQGRYFTYTVPGATGEVMIDWHGNVLFELGRYEYFAASFGEQPYLLAVRYSGSGFDVYTIAR